MNLATRSWRDLPDDRARRGSESSHHERGDYPRKKMYDRKYGGFSDDEDSGLLKKLFLFSIGYYLNFG